VLEFKTYLIVQTPELGGRPLAPARGHKHIDVHPLACIVICGLGDYPLDEHQSGTGRGRRFYVFKNCDRLIVTPVVDDTSHQVSVGLHRVFSKKSPPSRFMRSCSGDSATTCGWSKRIPPAGWMSV